MIKRIVFHPFESTQYPFNIGAFQQLKELDLQSKINIFVGDNGSGKSTLLKAIAYYSNSINVSKHDLDAPYYSDIQKLAQKMTISYTVKSRKGFFFSGEDFITYINNLKALKEQIKQEIIDIENEFKDKNDYARKLALGPLRSQLYDLNSIYNGELKERSHGEGFLSFFKARMHQQGLYIFDEPETPLSAINQYQLVVLITDLVQSGSQVIIATHSPIIMALKDATIYHFTNDGVYPIQYEDIESVQFMKHFLNDKDQYINRI